MLTVFFPKVTYLKYFVCLTSKDTEIIGINNKDRQEVLTFLSSNKLMLLLKCPGHFIK